MRTTTIQGFENYSISENGEIRNIKTGRILKPSKNKNGYLLIRISNGVNYCNLLVHRILMIHFIENVDRLPFVNHKDGNKLNNHLSNLEWCTAKHNLAHALETGLRKPHNKLLGTGRLILNLETGIYYTGTKEVIDSLSIKIPYKSMGDRLTGRVKIKTSFVLV